MKRFLITAYAVTLLLYAHSQEPAAESALVITAVFDGPMSRGTPKGVELYVLRDVPDLSEYGIDVASNGSGRDDKIGFTFPEGSAREGTFIYVESTTREEELDNFEKYFGFASDYQHFELNINGNDAVELFRGTEVVDVFGDIDVDGTGTSWEYGDGYAYRKSYTKPSGSEFRLDDFTYSGPGGLTSCEVNHDCASEVPLGSYVAEFTLPVELVVFGVEPTQTGALLSWRTASEIDNDYFEVEMSRDGASFASVGTVAGHGTTTGPVEYEFHYPSSEAGWHYFRLRQVDYDGRTSHSGIDSAHLGSPDPEITITSQGGGYIRVVADGAERLLIVNAAGAIVARGEGAQGGGGLAVERELSLGGLAAGVYVVTDLRSSRRFVVY